MHLTPVTLLNPQGVVGISEIIIKPGLVNVDFADVRSIMSGAGTALMVSLKVVGYIICDVVVGILPLLHSSQAQVLV